MSTPGSIVARKVGSTPGKVGVLADGKPAAFNAAGFCGTCCDLVLAWSFTDQGFIDGGQGGALRTYADPASVAASPWTIINQGLGLRLAFEDDWNCHQHNQNAQIGTATATFSVGVATTMTVDWFGLNEVARSGGEAMQFSLDSLLIADGQSVGGGGANCDVLGPPAAHLTSPPPVQVQLPASSTVHSLDAGAVTVDGLWHSGAFYEIALSFNPPLG